MKSPRVFHPLLFALAPLFFIFAKNVDRVLLPRLFLPSLIAIGITLCLLQLSRIFFHSSEKTGLFVSLFVTLFLIGGHASHFLLPSTPITLGPFILRLRVLYPLFVFPFLFLPLVTGVVLLARVRRSLHPLTRFLNGMSLSLILLNLLVISAYKLSHADTHGEILAGSTPTEEGPKARAAGDLPDIYYIIVDGYAGAETLREVYGYSNESFIQFLLSKGFTLPAHSTSNYDSTLLSLSSSLNMRYIHSPGESLNLESADVRTRYRQLIQRNAVIAALKKLGYRYIHFSSGYWHATRHNPFADVEYDGIVFGGLSYALLRGSILWPFATALIAPEYRQAILFPFEHLGDVPRMKEPTFTFVHLLIPHPPYLFEADGSPSPFRKLIGSAANQSQQGYLDQILFINKKLEAMIEELLTHSPTPPIILLQGDHGSRPSWRGDGSVPHRSDRKGLRRFLREKFLILNAYYLPAKAGTSPPYNSITPVNSFRWIFNQFFGANYSLLRDASYESGQPFGPHFTDVTEILHE